MKNDNTDYWSPLGETASLRKKIAHFRKAPIEHSNGKGIIFGCNFDYLWLRLCMTKNYLYIQTSCGSMIPYDSFKRYYAHLKNGILLNSKVQTVCIRFNVTKITKTYVQIERKDLCISKRIKISEIERIMKQLRESEAIINGIRNNPTR